MSLKHLLEWEAHWVYDILVEECGARDDADSRHDFVHHHTKDDLPGEYRFVGALGMGGKFYLGYSFDGRRMHVDYYPQDQSPERDRMVAEAKKRLAQLPATDPLTVRVGTPKRNRRSSLAERAMGKPQATP